MQSSSAAKKPSGPTPRMASPKVTTAAKPSPSRKSPLPGKDSPLSMANPARNEIVRLENVLKAKDMELQNVGTECKALKTTNASMEKAVATLRSEVESLKEKLDITEKVVEAKTLELREANELRRAAHADAMAAEAITRRLQAAIKDPEENAAEIARAALEAQLKLANKEIARLEEDAKTQDRHMRNKEAALLKAEKDIETALAKAAMVEVMENNNKDLARQLEASQEETRTVDKMYKQKVDEVKALSEKVDELQEALLKAGAIGSIIKDYERQIQDLQAEQKVLNEELARAKVAATRVAMAVANEWKDDNDKVITVKEWLEERRQMQGEMERLKEKLALAEKSCKYEIQMKTKAQTRLKVIEESLKAGGKAGPKASPRQVVPARTSRVASATLPTPSPSPSEQTSKDDGADIQHTGEDSVSGLLYDTLQKEVVTLRKTLAERESAYKEKETAHDTLAKKVELLMRAMDTDSKKYRREVNTLKEEVASLKTELATRGVRKLSTGPPKAAP